MSTPRTCEKSNENLNILMENNEPKVEKKNDIKNKSKSYDSDEAMREENEAYKELELEKRKQCELNTMESSKVLQKKTIQGIPDILLHIQHEEYRSFLSNIILESCTYLTETFFYGRETDVISQIRNNIAICDHMQIVSIFLILLNVDKNMKYNIVELDSKQNKNKIVRFFSDLKDECVKSFYIDETMPNYEFVSKTIDCYIIS